MTAWISYIASHPAAMLALATKLIGITLWSAVVARRVPDRLTSWLHAWLGIQAVQIALIFMLSAFGALSRTTAWLSLLALFGSGAVAYLFAGRKFELPTRRGMALALLVAIPLVLWVLRCVILPDFSTDAQAYGTVRIAMWMNYRSVFVHMPSEMINIFANEWNGELNALLYAFATGNIQGAMMGNAEILVLATIASIWAARRFGAGITGSALVGLLMATSPAFVGLAAVTKGDLLACVGVLMAIGLLERMTVKAFCLAAIWFALATGSKISVIVGAAIILCFIFATHASDFFNRRSITMLVAAGAISVLFVARFVANAAIYGHPFMRVGAEAAEPGIRTLIGNMALMGNGFVGFFPVSPANGLMFSTSLAAGLGACGWFAAAGAASGRLRLPGTHATLALLCCASLVVTGFLIPAHVWSFRYFLPFIAVLAVMGLVAFTHAGERLRQPARGAAVAVVIAAAVFDFWMCFIPGDISSPDHFAYAMDASIARSPLERAMIQFPFLVDEVNPTALGLDSGKPKTLAVLNEVSSMILVLQGSGGQNRLYLADTEAGLVQTANAHQTDYIVMAKNPYAPKRHQPFDIPGYRWISTGKYYDIAERK